MIKQWYDINLLVLTHKFKNCVDTGENLCAYFIVRKNSQLSLFSRHPLLIDSILWKENNDITEKELTDRYRDHYAIKKTTGVALQFDEDMIGLNFIYVPENGEWKSLNSEGMRTFFGMSIPASFDDKEMFRIKMGIYR